MDITTGDTTGRDALRDFLRAGTAITDAQMQSAWDAAVDATYRWILDPYRTDAPEGVQKFVLNVAAHIWRTEDSAGETQILPDGTIATGASVTSSMVRRYSVLGGPYVRTPRVVA